MMDVLCRLWIQLDERGKEDSSKTQCEFCAVVLDNTDRIALVTEIRTLIRTIVRSLSNQNPSILTVSRIVLTQLSLTRRTNLQR